MECQDNIVEWNRRDCKKVVRILVNVMIVLNVSLIHQVRHTFVGENLTKTQMPILMNGYVYGGWYKSIYDKVLRNVKIIIGIGKNVIERLY